MQDAGASSIEQAVLWSVAVTQEQVVWDATRHIALSGTRAKTRGGSKDAVLGESGIAGTFRPRMTDRRSSRAYLCATSKRHLISFNEYSLTERGHFCSRTRLAKGQAPLDFVDVGALTAFRPNEWQLLGAEFQVPNVRNWPVALYLSVQPPLKLHSRWRFAIGFR